MSIPTASRRQILLTCGAFATAFAAPALAAPAPGSAEAFVADIYSHYRGSIEHAPGVKLDSASDIRRYFEPSLAAIIIADEAEADRKHDVPTLDGDPFVDAQDWDITDIAWTIQPVDARHADVSVHFKNFKEPQLVRLKLVRLKTGWRVSDVIYSGDGGTLRGMFRRPNG